MSLIKVLIVVVLSVMANSGQGEDLPTGKVSTDYSIFQANAEANIMQMLTIPDKDSMSVLDDNLYLVVSRSKPFTGNHHTYAIKQYGLDARTATGCFEAWAFDGRVDSVGFGEAFCISTEDMKYLFFHGAFTLTYQDYNT